MASPAVLGTRVPTRVRAEMKLQRAARRPAATAMVTVACGLEGRRFRDDLDFHEQLQEWTATVADVRVHGTTHERPVDRFSRERDALVPAPAGRAFRAFRLEAPLTPEHGPGAIARNARLRYSTGGGSTGAVPLDVEVRDLACYEAAYGLGGAE